MPIIDSLKRDDSGLLTKGLVAVAVAGAGIGAYVAVRRWQQSHCAAGSPKGHEELTDRKAESGKEPPSSKTTIPPPPITVSTKSSQPVAPTVTPKEVAKPAIATPAVVPSPSAATAPPAAVPPKVVPPPAQQPTSPAVATISKPPRNPASDNNKEDLSASATFEKVPADGNSLPPASSSILHDVAKPQHAAPPSPAGGSASPAAASKPSMGGAKSLSVEESMFDSSIETPVFGGQPYSMLPDAEIEISNFNPATEHPAFFGFKFEGPSS